jgi:S-adenosylmethionine synthetase
MHSPAAEECLVQVSYFIGLVDRSNAMVNSYGTGTLPDERLAALVRAVFPLSPAGIIEHLHLREPVYLKKT